MGENFKLPEDQPKENQTENQSKEVEQGMEGILDVLELAFEKKARVKVIALEPSGELRTGIVFIEGFEDGILYVSSSKDSVVMGIPIGNVERAEVIEEKEQG